MSAHSEVIETRRRELAERTREDLLMRRAILESVMDSPQGRASDWQHDVADDDDPHLTLREQHDLLDEAIAALPNPNPPVVVGLKDGLAILRAFAQGETNA